MECAAFRQLDIIHAKDGKRGWIGKNEKRKNVKKNGIKGDGLVKTL